MSNSKVGIITFPYGINKVYGLGYWLKDYAYYPQGLPLFIYMDHGMVLSDKIYSHEINNDAPLIFKFSPRLVNIYRKIDDKPVYNLLNPTIHYRLSKRIEKSINAKGSLFFIAHSTEDIVDQTDWKSFIEDIKNIPETFKPIDICLHPTDVEKGLDKVFLAEGFRVVSAGSYSSSDFIANFYSILINYRYTISNLIGSYAFYSVDLGIPFSMYGDEPKYYNIKDKNLEIGAYESYKTQPTYQKAKSLFVGLHTSIDEQQKYFVDYELGKFTTVSRAKASLLLYKAYFIYSLRYPVYFKLIKGVLSNILFRRYPRLHNRLQRFYYIMKLQFK